MPCVSRCAVAIFWIPYFLDSDIILDLLVQLVPLNNYERNFGPGCTLLCFLDELVQIPC